MTVFLMKMPMLFWLCIFRKREVKDRVAWVCSTNGKYNVKMGYQFLHGNNVGNATVPRIVGWNKVWKLSIPHKVKIFIWRFYRNNIPERNRLKFRGVSFPNKCHACLADIDTYFMYFLTIPLFFNVGDRLVYHMICKQLSQQQSG